MTLFIMIYIKFEIDCEKYLPGFVTGLENTIGGINFDRLVIDKDLDLGLEVL